MIKLPDVKIITKDKTMKLSKIIKDVAKSYQDIKMEATAQGLKSGQRKKKV